MSLIVRPGFWATRFAICSARPPFGAREAPGFLLPVRGVWRGDLAFALTLLTGCGSATFAGLAAGALAVVALVLLRAVVRRGRWRRGLAGAVSAFGAAGSVRF